MACCWLLVQQTGPDYHHWSAPHVFGRGCYRGHRRFQCPALMVSGLHDTVPEWVPMGTHSVPGEFVKDLSATFACTVGAPYPMLGIKFVDYEALCSVSEYS
ncbi:hypothetical protein TNCT_278211 [Trichonephila clavata]|uniref:Uncharacterized protein n=1 Tax=Trichonephila clavata TaxID=2740835 RepID=A0A8X6H7E4_TRICU|nr:hypothetical protein TNCT_278211 [Trichonephila clavata]